MKKYMMVLLVVLTTALSACTESVIQCGTGTVLKNNECVIETTCGEGTTNENGVCEIDYTLVQPTEIIKEVEVVREVEVVKEVQVDIGKYSDDDYLELLEKYNNITGTEETGGSSGEVEMVGETLGSLSSEYLLVYKNSESGFNFPSLIFKPNSSYSNVKKHVVVEAYNTGGNGASNNIQDHIDEAIRYGLGEWRLEQFVANELNTYRVMPIIPRYGFYNPKTGEYGHSHGLDRDTMFIADNIDDIVTREGFSVLSKEQLLELDNLEEQIFNMINDAQARLRENGYDIVEKVFMTGFSAAGSFSSRFTSFYPSKVQAMYSGGMHVPFVPSVNYNGESLMYGVGAGDHLYLTGRNFSLEDYNNVAKLMYLEGQDTNDPFPYNDVFSPDQRQQAERLYGTDYLSRWNNAQELFFEVGGEGVFVTSKTMEHNYGEDLKELPCPLILVHF